MAELEELSHKLHVLIAQLEQVHADNEKLKHENKYITAHFQSEQEKFAREKKEVEYELDRYRCENEMLKRELEAMCERMKMMEMQTNEMSEPMPFARVKPYDSDWDASPIPENERRKGGGKKTSI